MNTLKRKIKILLNNKKLKKGFITFLLFILPIIVSIIFLNIDLAVSIPSIVTLIFSILFVAINIFFWIFIHIKYIVNLKQIVRVHFTNFFLSLIPISFLIFQIFFLFIQYTNENLFEETNENIKILFYGNIFYSSIWAICLIKIYEFEKDDYNKKIQDNIFPKEKTFLSTSDKEKEIIFNITNVEDNELNFELRNLCKTVIKYIYDFFKNNKIGKFCIRKQIKKSDVDKKNLIIFEENLNKNSIKILFKIIQPFIITLSFFTLLTIIILEILRAINTFETQIITYLEITSGIIDILSIVIYFISLYLPKNREIMSFKKIQKLFKEMQILKFNSRFFYYYIDKCCKTKLIIKINIVQKLKFEEVNQIAEVLCKFTQFNMYKINNNSIILPNNNGNLQISMVFSESNKRNLIKLANKFEDEF